MIRQIYHTSHCGSTLLAKMVSNNCNTYSEPDWVFPFMDGIGENKIKEHNDGDCIKFPNQLCNLAPELEGKKVFIYRKLEHHLQWMTESGGYNYLIYPGYQQRYVLETMHSSLIHLIEKCDTDLKMHALFWANNIEWIKEAKDVLYIDSNDFFLDKKNILKLVLDHFNIEEKVPSPEGNIDAKDPERRKAPEGFGIIKKISKEVKEVTDWWSKINKNKME